MGPSSRSSSFSAMGADLSPRSSAAVESGAEARRSRRRHRAQIQKLENDQRAEDSERYCRTHGKRGAALSCADQRRMRLFFKRLDTDGSGQISIDELVGPLIALGLADNMADVDRFMRAVDSDSSGQIDCDEFILALGKANRRAEDDRTDQAAADRTLPRRRPRRGLAAARQSQSLPALFALPPQTPDADPHPLTRHHAKAAKRDDDPFRVLQSTDHGDLDMLISERRRARLLQTIETRLPNISRLYTLQREEEGLKQLRQRGRRRRGPRTEPRLGAGRLDERLGEVKEERCRRQSAANEHDRLLFALQHSIAHDRQAMQAATAPAGAAPEPHGSGRLAGERGARRAGLVA